MSRSYKPFAFALSLLLIGGLAYLQYDRRTQEYRSDQFLMDTLITIKVYGHNPETLKKAVAEAYAEIRRIAELADGFPPIGTPAWKSSDVCRINDQAGRQAVRVDDDILTMLALAQKYHQLSEGAFDVTVGPLMELWGFGGNNPRVPEPGRVQAALALVGSDKLVLNEQDRTAFLRQPGMKLDLGAIAKGYATDEALKVLRSHGVKRALVSGGGDMTLGNPPPDRKGWRIEIAPLDVPQAPPKQFVLLANVGLATSGDVFQYVEIGGQRYSHIIDPRTGAGLTDHSLVTVIARDCLTADSLATAASVLGPQAGLVLVEQTRGAAAYIVRKPAEAIEAFKSKRLKDYCEPP